jgi:hypothetical protein
MQKNWRKIPPGNKEKQCLTFSYWRFFLRPTILDQWNCVGMQWDCRLSTGFPPPRSRLCRLWSRKEDLQWAWNGERRAVWDQVGWSHCRDDGLVTVRDEARLRRGHNDRSRQGHQCSKTTLTEESWFHISTPPADWTWAPRDGKRTGGPVELCWNAVRLQALHRSVKVTWEPVSSQGWAAFCRTASSQKVLQLAILRRRRSSYIFNRKPAALAWSTPPSP